VIGKRRPGDADRQGQIQEKLEPKSMAAEVGSKGGKARASSLLKPFQQADSAQLG
jgi:hypothetical protein